ncbi:aminopeptidase N-like isoform X2 [Anthonomus grandis grandis]|uniref:aminopeptidase N-like isoform X2 n=1 Tax=Anthonomus grandis grandis TaxID=2921223 RepID=UPI0021662740|nr:aminopeptidase N-like isoform X2 [Anthonomus grandis grandis]
MVGYYNAGVPTNADLENNSHQKKYTVNQPAGKNLIISKPLCTLMAIGALLLAILAGLVVFFLVPRGCDGINSSRSVASLTQKEDIRMSANEVDERLPRSIKPLKYTIQIYPDFQNSTTEGRESIVLQPIEDTNTIIFHADEIDIDKDSVKVVKAPNSTAEVPVTHQHYMEGERYKIVLGDQLVKGNDYVLSLNFKGKLNDQLQGFYRCQYPDTMGEIRYAASTQFSPTDARKAFPCFDDPSFKAKFKIRLARPANMTSLSNMPLESTEVVQSVNGTWFWDSYAETPEMSTYLVAFIISDLVKLHSSDSLISIWARREFLTQTDYAGKIAPNILKYFENYFRMTFPLPKIDIVAVPEFGFNAMENWGLITFRENSLLFDNYSSTVEDKRSIATILSHEIAHQWFGNLVTPKWWNDLWLKEGFATYLEYLGVNHVEPSWNILDEFLPGEVERAMALDSLTSSRPISFEVFNSDQIRQAFDEISYAKGACIIRMMNHFLGEETFKNGLIKYLDEHKYGNADRNDLFTSLTEEARLRDTFESNETVKQIMDTWTEQAGFPVVNVDPDYEKGTLKLIQKRFLLTDTSTKDTSKWWIPVSFTSSSAPDFITTTPKFWIKGETEVVKKVGPIGDWYLLNINQTGYYIVNYDEKNWKNIIENIMDFPPLIRAQLISDSMDLARANHLDYDIPLRLIARMAVKDVNIMFVPTAVALNKLRFLSDILYDTPAFGLFEEYHKAIFKQTYDVVDFNDNVDDYITRRIRQTVLEWSCRSPDSTCNHESRALFRNWMIKGSQSSIYIVRSKKYIKILPNIRSIIYCTAIREGSTVEWDFVYERFLETTSPTEKNILLDALGCTKLKWLLSRYLDKLIDGYSIRIQDADRVFESVARNEEGSMIAFDFLRKHWNEMLQHYGDGFGILGKMVKSLAVHMNTEFQLKELERFKDSVGSNISTTTQSFDAAIEQVRGNVEWIKKNYNQVEEWLTRHKDQFVYI